MKKRIWVLFVIAATIAGLAVAPLPLAGQTMAEILDAFKATKSQKYCDSIPYKSLRADCENEGKDVESYCDETSCKGLSYRDRQDIARKLEEEIREIDKRISNATGNEKQSLERDRDSKKHELEAHQRQIEDTKIQIQGRIEKSQRCRHAGLEVQKIFLRARNEAVDDGRRNEEIKKIAEDYQLRHWDEEGNRHSDAIVNIQTGIDIFSQRLAGNQ